MRSQWNRPVVVLFLLLIFVVVWYYLVRPEPPIIVPPNPPTSSAQNPPTAIPLPPRGPTAMPLPSSANRNLGLGNPSGAVHDASQPNNYLIERPQYVLSYNRDRGTANWVSWQVTQNDLGDVKRSNMFVSDNTLPKGWYRVTTDDYTGSGYDRGHMCPSADRTATQKDNQSTFTLTNVLPQAPDNNRNTWEELESYSRTLVNQGHVLYVIAGGDGKIGTIANGKITVPRYTWKIVVVLPRGVSDISAITADTPVIAIRVPNGLKEKLGDWDKYRVSVASIEQATGYQFFTNLPPDVQSALKSQVEPVPAT